MRKQYDLKAAVDALTLPRVVHTAQPDQNGVLRLVSVEHPALIDLLEHGTGTSRAPRGGAGGGDTPIPIDGDALERWAQIRDQVRESLQRLRAPWVDDLKTDLRTWYAQHEIAVARGRIQPDAVEYIERTVEAWRTRIEQKYDPDERREWTEPCPATTAVTDRWGAPTGEHRRCGQRRILVDAGGSVVAAREAHRRSDLSLQFAISLNITKLEAECRACGHRWEGERQLMQLRYEANLYELERELDAAAVRDAAAAAEQPAPKRELALTGPIDLP